MKIKVLETKKAASCPKGIYSKTYHAGEEYDIFDKLAKVFISQGWGEEPKEEPKKKAIKNLKNKAITNLENK